jgi:phage repressor protein C with HTH and peptisase S24 domain
MTLCISDNPGVFQVGDVLRKLRTDKGWSLEDLAEKSGVDKMTISKFERGLANARESTVTSLALAVGLSSAAELHAIAARDLPRHTGSVVRTPDDAVPEGNDIHRGYEADAIPVIAEGEATPHGLLWTTTIVRHVVIEYIARPYDLNDKEAYGLLVIGDSMEPVFRKGHRLIVSPNTPIEDGDEVYAQLATGERLIKVAFRIEAGWRLESINPQYAPLEVTAANVIAIHPIVWAKRKLPGRRVLDETTGKRR